MEAIINLLDCPVDEIEKLKKSTKNKNTLKSIEKWEIVFSDYQNQLIDQAAKNPKISEEKLNTAIQGSLKLVQHLIKGELYKKFSCESLETLNTTAIQLQNANITIQKLKNQVEIEKNRAEEYKKKVLEVEDQSAEGIRLLELKYKNDLKNNNNSSDFTMVSLAPISDNLHDNIIDHLIKHEEIIANATKICENASSITLEIEKSDLDKPKTDKRTAPVYPKKGKLIINIPKK